MAVKQVERRICDYCDREAHVDACLLCHKDFCFDHGDTYNTGDRYRSRPKFDLCDDCAKDIAAKLTQARKELSQREG